MKCKIISISHKLSNWEHQALKFYSKQLPSSFKISYAEAKPTSSKHLDKESILEAERLELHKYIDNDAHVILWDRKGKKLTVMVSAALLQDKIDLGYKYKLYHWRFAWGVREIIQNIKFNFISLRVNFSSQTF